MTRTDEELRDLFSPLREQPPPTDPEISDVLVPAEGARPARSTLRRRLRLALPVGAATAVAVAGFALLPGASTDRDERGNSGVALLNTAAANAAEQTSQEQRRYRYALQLSRFGRRTRTRIEWWIDSDWRGEQFARTNAPGEPSEQKRSIAGTDPPMRLAELPTEARALHDALVQRRRSDPNVVPPPGGPDPELERDQLIREVLRLLTIPNASPELRSALWQVLTLMPGVERAPDAHDPRGRDGEAVRIHTASGRLSSEQRPKDAPPYPDGPARVGTYTIVFDPDTSELLFWSLIGQGGGTPDQTHTIVRSGYVDRIGERP
jgi:hypothetical protein